MFSVLELLPYPTINSIISMIHAQLQAILDDSYMALILHGSLAAGGFDPDRSDVDFLVVTAAEMTETQYEALRHFHEKLSASALPWSTNIEGSFIPAPALYRYDPQNCTHPALRCDGSFGRDGHGTDWILQRWNIREYGISLYGPEPSALIAPVPARDMRLAVLGILRGWWEPMLTDEYRLGEAEYQAYAVMTMCRSFYTMATARVAPKPAAALYAQQQLGAQWAALIDEAAAWRHGTAMDQKERVKEFIRFTIDECAKLMEMT